MIPFKYCNRTSYIMIKKGMYYTKWYDAGDDQINFFRLCATNSKHAKKWKNVSIEYKINDYGFRNDFNLDDFDKSNIKNPILLTLGCSHTFGVGLPKEQAWCEVLAKKLNYFLVNLGVPGGSFDSITRVCREWLTHVDPDLIVIQTPNFVRREYIFNKEIRQIGPWTKGKWNNFSTTFWDDDENEFAKIKNLDLINFYNKKKIPVYTYDMNLYNGKESEKARDGCHYGPSVHKGFAEMIYNELERDIY